MFFNGGGIAYTCAGNMISRIADAKGERSLEPNGTVVTALAVTPKSDGLYYMAGDTAKRLGLKPPRATGGSSCLPGARFRRHRVE